MTLAIGIFPIVAFGGPFVQVNLSSDIPGLAANTDPNLVNPWGNSFSGTSPIWVSDQGKGLATLYTGSGSAVGLVVTIPGGTTPPQGPTGQVFNSTATSFALTNGNGMKATFIFDTLAGTIEGWNTATSAVIQLTNAGASYTGLALGTSARGDTLYAANFAQDTIDTVNSSFADTTLAGSFTDPNLPAGYVPYNVQNIGGSLYVEYAQVDPVTHRAAVGPGKGIVAVFDGDGNFVTQLITGGVLNAPWGITLAPALFPVFGGDLLVGNFGDGRVNAFNPTTGAFLGTLTDSSNNPIANPGLWGIGFRPAATGFDPNALYFTAGINGEQDGLFGDIAAAATTPEPGTLALMALGAAGLLLKKVIRRA
jgi:uncharacterized protein (TIGR03118 family)